MSLFQMRYFPFQDQLFLLVKQHQLFHELALEGLCQGCDIKQKIPLTFGSFPVTLNIDTSAWHNAMQMGMIEQLLCPGVQYCNHAHPGLEPLLWVF